MSCKKRLVLVLLIGFSASATAQVPADNPVSFGRKALEEALAARGLRVSIQTRIHGSGQAESYTIRGHAVAAEVERTGRIERIPGWEANVPYLVVPSQPAATPLLYSSEEVLTSTSRKAPPAASFR